MNHKATLITSALALLLVPACSGKSAPQDATPAAGALGNTLPKTTTTVKPIAIDSATLDAKIVVEDDHKLDTQKINPTTVQKVQTTQPPPPVVPPAEALSGARFGRRYQPDRKVVRLA